MLPIHFNGALRLRIPGTGPCKLILALARKGPDQSAQGLGIDGLGNKSVGWNRTQVRATVAAHQDPWNIFHHRIFLQCLQHLCAIVTGHHVVAQNQLRADFMGKEQSGKPVRGDDAPAIFAFDNRGNKFDEIRVVINNDNNWLMHWHNEIIGAIALGLER